MLVIYNFYNTISQVLLDMVNLNPIGSSQWIY